MAEVEREAREPVEEGCEKLVQADLVEGGAMYVLSRFASAKSCR